jgi:hypothetical protein
MGCSAGVGVGVMVEVGTGVAEEAGVWVNVGIEEDAGVKLASTAWLVSGSSVGASPTARCDPQLDKKKDRTTDIQSPEMYRQV